MADLFVDLIGRPYVYGETDCLWAVTEALQRIFDDFVPEELPSRSTRWRQVGTSASAAQFVGDVIEGFNEEGQAGVAVLVDASGRQVITSSPKRGSCRIPIRALTQITAVHRRRTSPLLPSSE